MKVYLKCFSTLANAETCDYKNSISYDLVTGQNVGDLSECAGISGEEIKLSFVNGRQAAFGTILSDGDRVALAPATGGM